VTYASVDVPTLPDARQRLADLLKAAGMPLSEEHGFTPHMTLAYDDVDVDIKAKPVAFDAVVLKLGDSRQTFKLTGERKAPEVS
jgi:2'-5' RNA ligase